MTESVEGKPLDERELITRAQNGDTEAFELLVRIYQTAALRTAYLVVRDPSEAEDVTQDALVKVYRSLGQFQTGAPFKPWLLKIVRNEALNRVRGTKRRRLLALRSPHDLVSDEATSPETEVVTGDEIRRLIRLVEDLPERYRDVVIHRYLLDLSEQETAEVLGLPLGTVKSRNSRALQRLRNAVNLAARETR